MTYHVKPILLGACALVMTASVWAKLPAPSDEAKAKAAEAAAKTAWSNKVAGYELCKSQDKAAAHYQKTAKAAGKELKAATATPACADPGAFSYTPTPSAPVAAAAATPAPAGEPAKKP